MRERHVLSAAVLGSLLALGLAFAGYFVGHALLRARASERVVTVKGLAQREVPADLAIWPIAFTVTANDLGVLQSRVDEAAVVIRRLMDEALPDAETTLKVPVVTDREAQNFAAEDRPAERYVAESAVIVRTDRVEALHAVMARSGELVKQGVALIDSYAYRTQYLFTGLDEIKPDMIAEATRDARRAAEQFAQDSCSRVGAIRTAQQGYFSVEDRDMYAPQYKRIRVVTTVRFFLRD